MNNLIRSKKIVLIATFSFIIATLLISFLKSYSDSLNYLNNNFFGGFIKELDGVFYAQKTTIEIEGILDRKQGNIWYVRSKDGKQIKQINVIPYAIYTQTSSDYKNPSNWKETTSDQFLNGDSIVMSIYLNTNNISDGYWVKRITK